MQLKKPTKKIFILFRKTKNKFISLITLAIIAKLARTWRILNHIPIVDERKAIGRLENKIYI